MGNDEFRRLYKKWILKSLEDQSIRVLITKSDNYLTGFVTVELLDERKSRIGLISVNENFQGRGLGSILIKIAENVSLESGRSILQVATQFENKPALILYEKKGFEIISKTFIYHLWSL